MPVNLLQPPVMSRRRLFPGRKGIPSSVLLDEGRRQGFMGGKSRCLSLIPQLLQLLQHGFFRRILAQSLLTQTLCVAEFRLFLFFPRLVLALPLPFLMLQLPVHLLAPLFRPEHVMLNQHLFFLQQCLVFALQGCLLP